MLPFSRLTGLLLRTRAKFCTALPMASAFAAVHQISKQASWTHCRLTEKKLDRDPLLPQLPFPQMGVRWTKAKRRASVHWRAPSVHIPIRYP
ncbi:hypothetical protein HYPSUDRAFT_42560 [Hypholoma sublateritium FD-334 SS-4]|uniref:Uncharacterized protein n=1 Tax=Hypholoma sublateritium (strain FD-334 SS-4) TaxID=945553 RepID=A0A0D2MC07_HYPSF|nr:hypothetical protein HYPSUDRAFT_42560 [Hypholoma sublateritium FD-334 SS-4]